MIGNDFQLLNWLDTYRKTCRYNLSNSGMPEPDLRNFGIDVSYDHFLSYNGDIEYNLKRTIAKMYRCEPENVLLTIGGSEAIFIASAFLSRKSRKVFVPLPEYEPMFLSPEFLGMETHKGEYSSLKGMIDADSSVAFTSPNNPTGMVSIGDEIISSSKTARYIYVDETFRSFSFSDHTGTRFDGTDRIIVSNTMTKFYGLSLLRTGWIIGSEKNIETMKEIKNLTSIVNPRYSLWISDQVLKKHDVFAERARRIVSRNRKMAMEYLEGIANTSWNDPQAAPFGILEYRKNMDSVSFSRIAAEKYGILVGPGSFFGKDKSFRVCLTSEDDSIAGALEELSKFLRNEL